MGCRKTMEINYINNNYYTELASKKTIIQVYNEHININNRIDFDKQTYKNFFTFGDIDTIVTYENITNNRLYEISKTTNDYKEIDDNKKWINTDSFTRESNITEKLHMNVKLDYFNLEIDWKNVKVSKEKVALPTLYDFYDCFFSEEVFVEKKSLIDGLLNSFYEKNISLFTKTNILEIIKLPMVLDVLSDTFGKYKNQLNIKNLDNKSS